MLPTPSSLPRPAAPTSSTVPEALPSFLNRPAMLPVMVDAPGEIDGGWPKPDRTGLFVGRCRLGPPPQGWRREDIVSAVMKVSYEDWQGGMPLASSRELGEYRRIHASQPGPVVWQRDDIDCLTGRAHPATLTADGQRVSGGAPRHASLQENDVVVDDTRSVPGPDGSPQDEIYQTRRLMRREYHAGSFELCLALNAESLQRLRETGELPFCTGCDDTSYALALHRATLSVTYGERRAAEAELPADDAVMGGLASMAGRWRLPGDQGTEG